MALLEVRDLSMAFGAARAVDGVSFTLDRGRVLGLVGESGCGKSMTALCLLRLVPPPGRILGGRVVLDGVDVLALSEREMQRVRGGGLAMIFQEPMTALNPVLTVGNQIAEAIRLHQNLGRAQAREQAIALLGEVGIPEPAQRVDDYPHQLSGGMRQRVMIAIGISCHPKVLIADEPTTALDVTIQAGILDLLAELRERHGMALLLITHDLGVVAEQADSVAIMYAGRLVEQAPTGELFDHPLHPYTQALLRAMPGIGRRHGRLETIEGHVPDLHHLPPGCAFGDRCPRATVECAAAPPPLVAKTREHRVACVHA